MLWLALAGMTALAVLAALWPILRPPAQPAAAASSQERFYKAQLEEIARDVERGQLPQDEAAAARAEAARRLIAASAASPVEALSSAAPRRRIAAAALIVAGVPAIAFALYGRLGHPGLPDEPLASRKGEAVRPGGVEAAVAGVEAHLIKAPDDGKGWAVIAPVYMRLGRFDDAVHAYSEALRLLGEDATRRSAYGEALVGLAGGVVTQTAREAFEKALEDRPGEPQARFYLALGAEQDGRTQAAIEDYQKLLVDSPKGAPWAIVLKARLAALKGEPPQPEAGDQAAPPAPAQDQQAMIEAMVARLAGRLANGGGDIAEWSRLIRAYSVLHEQDKARSALEAARKALGADPSALTSLDGLARDLGIAE